MLIRLNPPISFHSIGARRFNLKEVIILTTRARPEADWFSFEDTLVAIVSKT